MAAPRTRWGPEAGGGGPGGRRARARFCPAAALPSPHAAAPRKCGCESAAASVRRARAPHLRWYRGPTLHNGCAASQVVGPAFEAG
jgi:hypothetical protein